MPKKTPPHLAAAICETLRLAIEELLDGNSFEHFSRRLGVRLPNIKRAWLGRKEARW